MQMRFTWSQN